MHAPLPERWSVKQCPKCTCPTATEAYRAHRPHLNWAGDILLETFPASGGECILRTCIDCGYVWLEQCGDADPATGEATQ